MKIMVVYATAGSGHRRAAEAIYHCLEKNYPELNINIVDILEYTNFLFANSYSRGYSFLVTHLKLIWAINFYLTGLKYVSLLFKFICRLNCSRFINLLDEKKPDIVLTTHFFPAEVIAYLKQKRKIDSRLVTIVTDFGLHPLWVVQYCDDYIVASDYTRKLLISRGIKQDKIRVGGIPIDSGFLGICQEDRRRQGFISHLRRFIPQLIKDTWFKKDNKDEFHKDTMLTALVVTGAFGFSFIEKVVDILHSDMNLLVVCGNNQRLYNRLARKRYDGVGLFGFTDQMPRLMSQVDLLITKPGGLTIAEALALELPLIFICSIPGQEAENARILEIQGCAIKANNLKSLKDIIIDLKAHPERLDLMRANIRKIRKPNAAEEICRYVCSSSI